MVVVQVLLNTTDEQMTWQVPTTYARAALEHPKKHLVHFVANLYTLCTCHAADIPLPCTMKSQHMALADWLCRPSLLLLLAPRTWMPGWHRYCSAAVALPLPVEVSVCPAMSLRCLWGQVSRCAAAVPAGIPVS